MGVFSTEPVPSEAEVLELTPLSLAAKVQCYFRDRPLVSRPAYKLQKFMDFLED